MKGMIINESKSNIYPHNGLTIKKREDKYLSRYLEQKEKDNRQENKKDQLVSEYKIGHTTYIVELYFSFERGETLDDVIKRLMLKDTGAA